MRPLEPMPPVSFSLANELWRNVLQNFALQPLEIGQARPSEAFCSNRAALQQLCLTSRRFLTMARPYLYETIVLFSHGEEASPRRRRGPWAGSLVLLMRTLTQNHQLRPLIKNIAVPMTLLVEDSNSEVAYVEITRAWFENPTSSDLKPEDQEVLDVIGLKRVAKNTHQAWLEYQESGELGDLPQKLVAGLLCLTHNIETLLLQGLLTLPYRVLDQALRRLISHPAIGKGFLCHLKTFQIQINPLLMSDESYHDGPELAPARLSSPLLNQPELSRIDIWYGWQNELHIWDDVSSGIARLDDINLTVSAEPAAVDALIQQAKAVKSLSISLFAMPNYPDQEGDLNAAILRRSDTLESLALDTSHCSPERTVDQLGPLGRWTCLPQLHQLKHLTVEPHLLLDWLNANTWPRFFKTLPPNLEELTFRFMPENGEDLLRIWARSGVGVVLRASPEKWQSKMPRMKHIHFQPLPYSTRAAEVLKEDLKQARIDLTWYDPDLSLGFAGLSLN